MSARTIVQVSDLHLGAAGGPERGRAADEAWAQFATAMRLDPPELIVVTGDIVVDDPDDTADGELARARLAELGIPLLVVPGNHDVGDHAVREGLPSDWHGALVTAQRVTAWEAAWGPSYSRAEVGDWTLLGLNSQLFGSGLAQEAAQWAWLHAELADAAGRNLAVFMHESLHLRPEYAESELANGWMSVPRAASEQLAELLASADARLIACGHTHSFAQWHIGDTLAVNAPGLVGPIPVRDTMDQPAGTREAGWVAYELAGQRVSVSHVARAASPTAVSPTRARQRSEATPMHALGARGIDWAASRMPLLAATLDELGGAFAGRHVGICLHIEPKTGVLVRQLLSAGARVTITGNLGTSDPVTAAALRSMGAEVIGDREDSPRQHAANLAAVLTAAPDLVLDNGAEMLALLAAGAPRSPAFAGATEETTTGGVRLRQLADPVDFPVIVINDSPLKLLVENEFGVGQSVVQGFMNATNTMLPGARALVVGYGPCGRGVANTLQRLGARVAVAETDPLRALEALMHGHSVGTTAELLAEARLVFLATGRPGVLAEREFPLIADGAVIAGVGHEPTELDLAALRDYALGVRELSAPGTRPDTRVAYALPGGREVTVLHGGTMVNLAAAGGNPIQAMDLGLSLQARSLAEIARSSRLSPGVQPVPDAIDRSIAARLVELWR